MILRTVNAFYGSKNIFIGKYRVSAFQRWSYKSFTTSEREKITVSKKLSEMLFFVVFCEQNAFEFPLFLVTVSFVPIIHKIFSIVFTKCYLSAVESMFE